MSSDPSVPNRWNVRRAPVLLFAVAITVLLAIVLRPTDRAEAQQQALDASSNLAMIRSSTIRNTNHDDSPWRTTPMADLLVENHLGPRSDYLNNPGGNPEQSFPVEQGGQFRTSCEFSHFAFDDPLVHPGEPGAAHLHMFFGNTDTNAFTTYESLRDSGSSTCNGQELNRTGYWVPAMFDGVGNVRIPERIVVYYKGEGLANGASEIYPPGAAMIPTIDVNTISFEAGGTLGLPSFKCSDQWSGSEDPVGLLVPACDGSRFFEEYGVVDEPHVVLEMNVKFPQCWNRQDPSDPANFALPEEGSWYFSLCPDGWATLPNLEYFVNYRVEIGENTDDWYLSSDVDPATGDIDAGGTTLHGDWWGAWHPDVNQQWIDNCVNFAIPGEASGCGMGYLTNGGPDNENPLPGPALKFRPQYDGPSFVAAEVLHAELCPAPALLRGAARTAYCDPFGSHLGHGSHGAGDEPEEPGASDPSADPEQSPADAADDHGDYGGAADAADADGQSSDGVGDGEQSVLSPVSYASVAVGRVVELSDVGSSGQTFSVESAVAAVPNDVAAIALLVSTSEATAAGSWLSFSVEGDRFWSGDGLGFGNGEWSAPLERALVVVPLGPDRTIAVSNAEGLVDLDIELIGWFHR